MKIPHIVLERRTLWFSSYKNRELKVKLWWVGARERKKRLFLYRLFHPKGNFLRFVFYLNVYCTEYIFEIYILLHIKKHFIHFCCLFLKSSKVFCVSLTHVSVVFLDFYIVPPIFLKLHQLLYACCEPNCLEDY